MRKIILVCILIWLIALKNYGQTKPDSTFTSKDSMALLAEFMNMLDSADKPASYVYAGVSAGNRLFSMHNNSINSKQTTKTLVYSPTIGYFHKSGLSFSAGANVLNDKAKGFGIDQFFISPAYELPGDKKFGFGISYTRYFVKDKFSPYSSPVQNDFYTSFSYKKLMIEPGIAFGYSEGVDGEIVKINPVINGTTYHFVDSGVYKIRSFSMMLSAAHNFECYGVLKKADGLAFTPALDLNFSSDSTQSVSHTLAPQLRQYLANTFKGRRIRNKLPKLQGRNEFQATSIGVDLDLNYSIGNFTIEPQLYLDYYFPETSEKKFTQVFTFTIGYTLQ